MNKLPGHFRILLVDDNAAIHEDFRKVLLERTTTPPALEAAEAVLFNTPATLAVAKTTFEIDSAYQGKEALEKVLAAAGCGKPYALAFVDVRMPPGWDGVETITRLWKADPALQVVICTAYADYSWETMSQRLGGSDNCLILKKPFDNIEVLQLAHTLTRKWQVTKQAMVRMEMLEAMVQERTHALLKANDDLRRSEERFETAFRASPVALAIQTATGERFVDANDAFLRLSGFSREELLGRTAYDLNLRIDYEEAPRLPTDGGASHARAAQISSDKSQARHALVSTEHITVSGESHVLLQIQDVTDRLQLESQLRQSQKMEAVGQLAAGVAHDFNNLLTVIQGHSSLQLAVGSHDSDLESSLQQIEQAAGRAAELTRQLLAFSRRQIMRPRILNMREHLPRLADMLQRLIGEQIVLRYEIADAPALIYADQTSIEQAIINLVINARDAISSEGSITLSVRQVSTDIDYCLKNTEALLGDYVCLAIRDTGVGMDKATLSRIFEPFFTTKEIHKGTGMGLAMVYGIVKQHEGWIEVETAPGSGSTFRILLPLAEGEEESSGVTTISTGGVPQNHTILIVEDDHAVRGLVKEVLTHDGYCVLEADSGDAALELWGSCRDEVELLLTDMVMPGKTNGLQLAARLLADKPELKVIYTSGYSTELFNADLNLRDGVNYLPKPYLSSKLIGMLRNSLGIADAAPLLA